MSRLGGTSPRKSTPPHRICFFFFVVCVVILSLVLLLSQWHSKRHKDMRSVDAMKQLLVHAW